MNTSDLSLRQLTLLIVGIVLCILILCAAVLSFFKNPVAAKLWNNLFPLITSVISGLVGWALAQSVKN